MAKNEKDKQTTAHMTQHRKLTNKQHEPLQPIYGVCVSCFFFFLDDYLLFIKIKEMIYTTLKMITAVQYAYFG